MAHSIVEVEKALSKAKIHLMMSSDSVFFTTVCLSLHHKISSETETADVDGYTIRFNPAFFMGLTEEERVFLLLHETLHAAFMHVLRLGNGTAEKWNHACDYVINDMLIQRNFKMPSCGLHDPQYRNMSAEDVYKLLPDSPQNNGIGLDLAAPGSNTDNPDTGGSQKSEAAAKEFMDEVLVRAATQSKMSGEKPGSVPGELEIYIDSLINPQLPWYAILRKYMHAFAKTDYTFSRPNRRFLPDFIMPTQHGEALGEIAVAVDTSGSVSDAEFMHFVSETYAILKTLRPKAIKFIQFDTSIKSITEVKTVQQLMNIRFTGRGGTDISEVMEWARDNNPTCLLMFTDGYFHPTNITPRCPVKWVIHSNKNFTAPYGQVIPYSFN